MTYKDFYKISQYLNNCNNNIFNNEEVAYSAYDYLIEYQESITQNKLTNNIITLCWELLENMCDYDEEYIIEEYHILNIENIKTMEEIFKEFLENC